jgi:hypothetical protein
LLLLQQQALVQLPGPTALLSKQLLLLLLVN